MLVIKDNYGIESAFTSHHDISAPSGDKILEIEELTNLVLDLSKKILLVKSGDFTIDLASKKITVFQQGVEVQNIDPYLEEWFFSEAESDGILEAMNKMLILSALNSSPPDFNRLAQLVGMKEFPQERIPQMTQYLADYPKCMAFLLSLASNPDLATAYVEQKVDPQWESFVVRREGWNKIYASSDQKTYGTAMSLIAKETANRIKGGHHDFHSLINLIASERRSIGYFFSLSRSYFIGYPRSKGYTTELSDIYAPLGEKLKTLLCDLLINPAAYPYILFDDEEFVYIEKLGDKNIKLSALSFVGNVFENVEFDSKNNTFYLISEDDDQKKRFGPTDFLEMEDIEEFCIRHTCVENINVVMDFIDKKLFPQLLEEDEPEKVMQLAGEIFWWICQAKPWRLGDPSIAEALIKGVFEAKGMEIKPWKLNLIPWEEVCLEPSVHAFGAKFHTLMETD